MLMTIFQPCRLESVTFRHHNYCEGCHEWQGMLWTANPGGAIYMTISFSLCKWHPWSCAVPSFPNLAVLTLSGIIVAITCLPSSPQLAASCPWLCLLSPCTYWCLQRPLYSYDSFRIWCLFSMKSWSEALWPRTGDIGLQCWMWWSHFIF